MPGELYQGEAFNLHGGQYEDISPDGKRIAKSDNECIVRVYDSGTGAELAILDDGFVDIIQWVEFASDNDEITIRYPDVGDRVWTRTRPEQWYGVFYLKEFWATLLFSLALLWSLRRDWKGLARGGRREEGVGHG